VLIKYIFSTIYFKYKNYTKHLKKEKIEIYVFSQGDGYISNAFEGKYGVYNIYGSTPEMAKELALFKLEHCLKVESK
jgi:hypothetical protein